MSNHILSSEKLSFSYPNNPTVFHFEDIHIQGGQHSLLLGDSGSGKTTLLHLLSGLSKPLSGKVMINDTDLYSLSESQLDAFRAQHLGFIFQEAHLLKNLTVLENVQLAQFLAKQKQDSDKIMQVLSKLQLAEKAKSLPQELSRGQVQRVAIARAIINNPKLLLADEPTASLDDTNTKNVIELMLETASTYGATLLIATHDKRIKDHFTNTYQL